MTNPFVAGTRLAAAASFAFGALAALGACQGPHRSGEQSRMTLPGAEAQGRKAGLWEQKVSDGQTSQVTRLCLDGAAHRAMAYLGDDLNRSQCSKHGLKRAEDGVWTFSSTCADPGGGQITTTGSATGDFTSHYQLRLQRTRVGGVSPGAQRFVVDAAWKGACPAGMKPGDMVLADGRKAAISQINPSRGSREGG